MPSSSGPSSSRIIRESLDLLSCVSAQHGGARNSAASALSFLRQCAGAPLCSTAATGGLWALSDVLAELYSEWPESPATACNDASLSAQEGPATNRKIDDEKAASMAPFNKPENALPFLQCDTLARLQNNLTARRWPDEFLSQATRRIQHLESLRRPALPRARTDLRLLTAGEMKPHPEKESSEDAFFQTPHSIGVADGVSEWRVYGLDPRLFAEQLMQGCIAASNQVPPVASSVNRATLVLSEGFAQVEAFGGSTATLACLNTAVLPNGERTSVLDVANIGDSTLILLRRDHLSGEMRVVLRTVEMQHIFNSPYQIIRLPELSEVQELRDNALHGLAKVTLKIRLAGVLSVDTTEDAASYRIPLQEGDLIIVGTDGLFDNLYEDEIAELASLAISPVEAEAMGLELASTDPKALCTLLVDLTNCRSVDHTVRVPFNDNAVKAGVGNEQAKRGGKPDDVAVVAAWVTRGGQAPCR